VDQRKGPQPPPRAEQGLREGDRRDLLLRQLRRPAPPRRAALRRKEVPGAGTDWVVGWATYFEDSGEEWEYSVKKTEREIDWFLHNPVPQISSFWRTEAFKKAGPFTEKYLWGFDYEYWMRLYFVAGYRPKVVKRCLGEFRLQPNSKTVSKPENYAPDFKGIHEGVQQVPHAAAGQALEAGAEEGAGGAEGHESLAGPEVGRPKAARGKALEAVKHQMTSLDAWRVMYCALRGR
jgi:hypothetical protein